MCQHYQKILPESATINGVQGNQVLPTLMPCSQRKLNVTLKTVIFIN